MSIAPLSVNIGSSGKNGKTNPSIGSIKQMTIINFPSPDPNWHYYAVAQLTEENEKLKQQIAMLEQEIERLKREKAILGVEASQ